jgi:phosphatidylglycerol lysyltransferase
MQMFMFNSSSKALDQAGVLPDSWVLPVGVGKADAPAEAAEQAVEFSFEERMKYMRKYGSHCMSFSTLQPGMNFFDVPGKGFIAYMQKWGSHMVLSDPICHEDDRAAVIGKFLDQYPGSAFIQISEPVARLMHERFGFYATQFGIETVIDLKKWSLAGKKKQVLRTSLNQAKKKGVVIRENPEETRHHQLSKEWIATRKTKNREIAFVIRPMVMDHEENTRKFFAYLEDELIGFIFFDPIYKDGEIISYVPNISRFSHSFRQGIFYSLLTHAIETFKAEGFKEVNLGLSVLVLDDEDEAYESELLKNLGRLVFKYGNFIYNFKGVAFTKSRFLGKTSKFYAAHKRYCPAAKLFTLFKISNII